MAERPFNRRQALDNARFLAALARTGNARLAARELGVHRSTYTKRRARSPAFAARWDMALAAADAAMDEGTVTGHGPRSIPRRTYFRTKGGELVIVRLRTGRCQLRRSPPGRMTGAAEDAFFDRLEGTANIRLAAEAAGFAHSSLLARARSDPAFAAAIADSLAHARRTIAEAERRRRNGAAAEAARLAAQADPKWPEGLTVERALHMLGAPPMKLPCTPFPKRKPGRR